MTEVFAYPPPTDGKPFRLTLGLRELDPEKWLEYGSDAENQLVERNTLIVENIDAVYQVLPGHDIGIDYFVNLLKENISTFHPNRAQSLRVQIDENSLLSVGRDICEDICVLRKIDGQWILVAALVVFPSRWDVREKIGLTIDEIHRPVPGYDISLQPLMSETFDRLHPDRPVWRRNWSLHATSMLHEPRYGGEIAEAEDFWWRTERQTLTKSQDGQFILFTIRNRAEPLAWIKSDPEAAQAFAQTLSTLSPAMLEYKRIVEVRHQLIEFLRG